MTTEEHSIYIELQGATYYAVHQLTAETDLSLSSALDLLVAKGVKMVNFERVGDGTEESSLDSLLTKLDSVHEQIDKVIEKLRTPRL